MIVIKSLHKFFLKITSYEITKRQRFILMSFFLTIVLFATQTVSENIRYQVMGLMVVSTVLLAIFALWGELAGIKYFLLLLLPIYFVAGASLFYFLLPVRWLTKVPYAFFFGISVYLLMLTSNIYNVAAIRTIALLRAAHAVGLLFSLIATFFLGNVLFSLHLPFYLIAGGVVAIVAPLYLVGLWSLELEDYISKRVFMYSLIFTLVTTQIGLVLSFWPIVSINGALVLATVMYVLLGLAQFNFENRLKTRIIWEHLSIAAIVFVIVLISTRWGG
ncbi:hypothetical protein A2697_03795 [Candidatus Curtissbacteria bacterium RIFCSPHIGHO2_01_FULL_41_44]|uniref:Uncharacterized protein n=1 Tax=Candidatus Curtissbacteria bacterium RIFCSPLOWO2_01_FULL_42_50 TaxID=1797730 RepID=A0A1F5H7Z0_9BACT|nr:MAG: hypothetical protein A2697_03795 [Candidatus Curtissbacteria bacterium RIFCSPHIGHO2_01_FULL_41_44]OGD94289.1 MAG: hypothetical protein A3C33_02955 [Candidatus Curtissbacteria bacterium RIFCSPHIGHO2_02_FULL_42_58]OGD97763.1 MAG: hypothetical protein A3E71_03465 [Candidatus Curtissbacteria bacterium RIFCSPHIGHO2_12_FULL_42_33]OGE00155.1 MAG: hypothetical protein A3B54_02010 [Candidatus Curtissbacteria bacterium RIFCSPLOWO2_01_FULL_42_50]OGE02081.1 MAG: hypothetical protein A3G16_00320 [Ca